MLEERRLAVLRAIVEDYVVTQEPVGSKSLAERHQLGVSPATVRNDMSALEDEGYIAQPHTSAGRVPTDKGYRLFVDRLSTVKAAVVGGATGDPELPRGRGRPRRRGPPVGAAARAADPSGCGRAVPLVVPRERPARRGRAARRPAGCCSCSSPTRAGSSSGSSSSPARSTTTRVGRAAQQPQLGAAWPPAGRRARRARRAARRRARRCCAGSRPPWSPSLLEALVERPEERIALAGTANLTRFSLDFPHSAAAGPGGAGGAGRAAAAARRGGRSRHGARPHRARKRRRGPADDEHHQHRVRPGRRCAGRARGARPDPDGLSRARWVPSTRSRDTSDSCWAGPRDGPADRPILLRKPM